MEERIIMNTKSLQKHFKSEYESFFAKNDLVLSASNSFPWNLGFGHNKNKIHIKQKLPTKTYIGVNIINEPKVIINSINFFDITDKLFDSMLFENVNKKHIEVVSIIQDFLNSHGYDKGIEINFLSENPRGHGLAFSGTAGVLMATSIYLILGKITLANLKKYDDFMKSEFFEEIFQLSRKIDDVSKYGNSIGNNCYTTMSNGHLPAVIFCEEYDLTLPQKQITTYKYKIKDFLGINNDIDELHLDYGVIYSGIENKIEQIHQSLLNTEDSLQDLENKSLSLLKNNGINKVKNFPFGRIFENHFSSVLQDAFFVLNFKLLSVFKSLLETGFSDNIITEFIQTINESNDIGMLFEEHNKLFNLYRFWFNHYKKFDEEMIGIFPINTSKTGGSFVFVTKHNKSRDTITKTIEKLQEIGYTDLCLEYISRKDGTCGDGIIVNQWIKEGMFSEYIQKDQVFYKDNQGTSFVSNYNEILAKQKNGLLLDMIHNKIYLNGKKLTSTDLCSQTTTINVLYKLMEQLGQDISNKEFEISSYSKNKNEMLGKIVLPLISLIEKEMGENFPLICKGSIYDFYMKLNPSIIKISYIRKM